jgi:hypothetical protein
MKKIIIGSVISIVAIVIACSVASKNEIDNDAKVFLEDFRDKLSGTDEDILKLFVSNQDKEEILKGISILQNKDTAYSKVKILFDQAKSSWADSWLIVLVPVELKSKNTESPYNITVSLKLFRVEGKFYAASMDAEELYKRFTIVKNELEHEEELSDRMAELKVYYDRAKQLQKNYDTVVWFVNQDTSTYYYVVNGGYNFEALKGATLEEYKMGLVDKAGRVIVPVEYELIGNPSMVLSNCVEVSKGGKIGYYSLDGKAVVPVEYDWLVPYSEGTATALVLKDSIYGWLDKEYQFHSNFPSKAAEESIKGFDYLTSNTFSYKGNEQNVINVLFPWGPDVAYRGNGLIMPSAYLVRLGIFEKFNDNFITNESENIYQYGNNLLEAKSQKPFSISDALSGFVTAVEKRFIGGRGEFYAEQKVSLLDKEKNIVSSFSIFAGKDLSFKKINDSLYQYSHVVDYQFEMGPGDSFPEQNFPFYGYFLYDGKKMQQLSSVRRFDFTQFVKIDSSFLTGNFDVWDSHSQRTIKANFVSNETIGQIRDEILASYGFVFPDQERNEQYLHIVRNLPVVSSYDEVYSKASEIDKYNLDFLNKLIGSTPGGKSI